MHAPLQIVKKYLQTILLFFLLFQICRLHFVVYNHDLFQNNILVAWLQSAYHGLRLDFSASAYCLSPLIILWLIVEISKRKFIILQKIYTIIILSLNILITLADAELYRAWGNKFNSQVLVYISHPIEMALSAGSINWIKTVVFALVLIWLNIKIYKAILKVLKQNTTPEKKNILFLLLLAGINFIVLRGGTGVATISQSSAFYSNQSINNSSAVNSLWNGVYYIFTNTENIYGKKLNYLDESDALILFKSQVNEVSDSVMLFNTPKPNILIVMLESFTANASQYFSGNNNCTPYLDTVARQSMSFMQCYASGDRTEKGLVSVLSGYPAQPSSSIIVFPDKMAKLPSLSKTLKKEGYTSLFGYGGDVEFASMKSYLVVQQFDEIFDKENFSKNELNSKWGAHDEYLYSNTIAKLKTIQKPFFSTIMTLSSHEPFDVPFNDPQLKKDEWYGLKNAIKYADKSLYTFLENCKKEPWYDKTVIVLVADHGHDIGLKNIHYFGPEKYHIPLIITGGALKAEYRGKAIENIVSQTVIPQLLLGQLNLSANAFRWQTGAFNKDGFAQYHFNNGIGRVTKSQQCLFDNESKACYYYKGAAADSALFLNQAKAFQQELVKDFLSK